MKIEKYNTNNIFYKILQGTIPSEVLYDHKDFIIIKDINPQDKFHYLLIVKKEISNLRDYIQQKKISEKNLFYYLSLLSEQSQIIINDKPYQEIPHLHFHILRKVPMDFTVLE